LLKIGIRLSHNHLSDELIFIFQMNWYSSFRRITAIKIKNKINIAYQYVNINNGPTQYHLAKFKVKSSAYVSVTARQQWVVTSVGRASV